MDVTFITGNTKKAETLAKYLGYPVAHQKVDLDELQSLDLREIVEHKVKQAYSIVGGPVIVEDVSFTMEALGGKLPGPFIKWFIEEIGFEGLCRLCDLNDKHQATTSVCYGFYDGKEFKLFQGSLEGTIPDHPRGEDGFGFNCIFIPAGASKTNAEMTDEEVKKYTVRPTQIYPQLKQFLQSKSA